MTTFLPRLDIEQVQESTLFFLAEAPSTDSSVLDLMVKYFLTTEALIEKIVRHPRVEKATLNYIRLFAPPPTLSFLDHRPFQEEEPISDGDIQQKRVLAIGQLRVPEKIKLALKGNREARSLLLRDPNRLVALAVLESPKLTEDEVEGIAQARNVSEEVLRVIARHPTWTRKYSVRQALTCNPKTPIPVSLGFLRGLRESDMDRLAKDKGVPTVVRTTAVKIINAKRTSRPPL